MSKSGESLYSLRLLDELSKMDTGIHRINPLVKIVTTVIYLIIVASFGRYETISLLPLFFYPVIIFSAAELPKAPILKRVLLVEPFIIGIGILNPIFDSSTFMLGSISVSCGWLTFLSIIIKGGLTVIAGLLLMATTGMDKLAAALRKLRVHRLFVLQLILTYRYITVLMEEVYRMQRAYGLRAPGQKGISIRVWGSFAGQLLLRTYDRAQHVYRSMNLRGFCGEYHTGETKRPTIMDYAYLAGWSIFFFIVRIYNMPIMIGSLFTGVIK
ncbi:MAG: cobalt ECF transporter T component CbiQ [Pseudomonadota bacterium]